MLKVKFLFAFFILVNATQLLAKELQIKDVDAIKADVTTVDGIINTLYDSISGPKGQKRQWERTKTLGIPSVQFVMAVTTKNGSISTKTLTFSDYVNWVNDYFLKNGFVEKELGRKVTKYGNIAHVLSSYESRHEVGGKVIARGVNSIQLFFDGKRWWIVSILWDSEREGNPIPQALLSLTH